MMVGRDFLLKVRKVKFVQSVTQKIKITTINNFNLSSPAKGEFRGLTFPHSLEGGFKSPLAPFC